MQIERELDFNADYGDFVFENDDIVLINNRRKICTNIAVERLKSAYSSVFASPGYGAADLESFIGSGIDTVLVEQIESAIINCLTFDNFLSPDSIKVLFKIDAPNRALFVRVLISKITEEDLLIGFSLQNGDLTFG